MSLDLTQLIMCHEGFQLLQKLWQEEYRFIFVFVYPSHNLPSYSMMLCVQEAILMIPLIIWFVNFLCTAVHLNF